MNSASNGSQIHYRCCNLCEAMCGIEIKTEGQKIISIRGDDQDPLSRGYICPKAVALQDLYNDPDRLKYPVRRTQDGWQRISWEEAFSEVVRRIQSIRHTYGKDALAVYLGNPNAHNYGFITYGFPFVKSLRTRNRYSATSIDQLPHHLAALSMFGHQALLPVPDIDRTEFFLILGANPAVSNGSLMSAPGVPRRIGEIRQRGGKVVVIDPRYTETAKLANRHHFIRPGADAFLLLALLQVTLWEIAESAISERAKKILDFCTGMEDIRRIVREFSPDRVAGITGIAAEDIRQIAREFNAADTAVCYGRLGTTVQEFGAITQWLINTLNIVTGNFDQPGGAMFTKPAFNLVYIADKIGERGHFAKWRSRVHGLPEHGGEFPVSTFADEILTEGEGQIKGLITIAGNPVLSAPNGKRLDQAFTQLDFMVAIDFYINETTRHAHIILPPTSSLEHENYNALLYLLSVRNIAKYSPTLFEPQPDTRHDWEIFLELMTRIPATGPLIRPFFGLVRRILRFFPPERLIDIGLRLGAYGGKWWPFSGLTLAKVKKNVHGLDLGSLQPCLPKRLYTKDKRIQLAPDIFVADLVRLEKRLQEWQSSGDCGLVLIGRRHLRSNNSWMHNSQRLVRGKNRCTAQIHPEDARQHEITDGDTIRVCSRVGSVEIEAEVTAEVMPGVVSIPHGWGHNRAGVQLRTAQKHAGVSVNDITDESLLDMSGNSAVNGMPIWIERG